MVNNRVIKECYFEWLYDKIAKNRYGCGVSFKRLLLYLHNVEFVYSIPKDANRARDGLDLRHRFATEFDEEYGVNIEGPCTVLEMMVALAIRCEETIMDNATVGDRTGQWFWGMICNLGLGSMVDDNFDEKYVEECIDIFLSRCYAPDGRGGLFTVRDCDRDLRTVEIWYQLCWYLDSIL